MTNEYIPKPNSSQRNEKYGNNEIFFIVQLAQIKQSNDIYCLEGYGENNLLLICWCT